MHNHRNLFLLASIATLTATFTLADVAEAGPIGGNVAPTEVSPPANDNGNGNGNGKAKGKKAPGRAARLIAGPGTAPDAGVIAPRPDRSAKLLPKVRKPVMADLLPGQLMRMSVGGGIELADGIAAGVSAEGGLFTTGTLFGNEISMRAHTSAGSPDDTVQVVMLPESARQAYDFEIGVSNGVYNVSVDALWLNDSSGGAPVDHDELLAVGKQRASEGKLRVTINPDPSWKTGPTAYFVVVSRDGADWTFRGATIARAL
jgi:hypothetical protein